MPPLPVVRHESPTRRPRARLLPRLGYGDALFLVVLAVGVATVLRLVT